MSMYVCMYTYNMGDRCSSQWLQVGVSVDQTALEGFHNFNGAFGRIEIETRLPTCFGDNSSNDNDDDCYNKDNDDDITITIFDSTYLR